MDNKQLASELLGLANKLVTAAKPDPVQKVADQVAELLIANNIPWQAFEKALEHHPGIQWVNQGGQWYATKAATKLKDHPLFQQLQSSLHLMKVDSLDDDSALLVLKKPARLAGWGVTVQLSDKDALEFEFVYHDEWERWGDKGQPAWVTNGIERFEEKMQMAPERIIKSWPAIEKQMAAFIAKVENAPRAKW